MFDVLKILLDRLQSQEREIGIETQRRISAEQKAERVSMSGSDVIQMVEAMASGRKIDAIKLYRQMTGYSLKESKDAIERVTNQFAAANAA